MGTHGRCRVLRIAYPGEMTTRTNTQPVRVSPIHRGHFHRTTLFFCHRPGAPGKPFFFLRRHLQERPGSGCTFFLRITRQLHDLFKEHEPVVFCFIYTQIAGNGLRFFDAAGARCFDCLLRVLLLSLLFRILPAALLSVLPSSLSPAGS